MRVKAPIIFCDHAVDGRPCLGLALAWAAAVALAGCGGESPEDRRDRENKTLSAQAPSTGGIVVYDGADPVRAAAEAEALARVRAMLDEFARTGQVPTPPAPPTAAN